MVGKSIMNKRAKTRLAILAFSAMAASNLSVGAQEKTYQQYLDASRNAKQAEDLNTADKLCDFAIKLAKDEYDQYESLDLKGIIQYQKSNFAEARNYFQQAIKALLAYPKSVHSTKFADVYEDLGRSHQKLRDFKEAEKCYDIALEYLKKDKSPRNDLIGHLYFAKAQINNNEADAREAVRLLQTGTSDSDKEALISANLLVAHALVRKGQTAQAEEMYKQSIEDRIKLIGTINHKNNAYTLTQLGMLYEDQDRITEAEDCYKRALNIAETVRGPIHYQVSSIASRLASVYSQQSEFAEAEKYEQQALTILEKLGAPDSPDCAILRLNIDLYRREQEKQTRSEAEILKSIDVITKAFGENSIASRDALMRLASYYEDTNLSKSRELVARALAIAESSPKQSPIVALTRSARLAILAQDYKAAESFLTRLLKADQLDTVDRDKAEQEHCRVFGQYYRGIKNFVKAERLLKRDIYNSQKTWGDGHPEVGIALSNLATLYLDERRYWNAFQFAEPAHAIVKARYGQKSPKTLKATLDLAKIYAAAGDYKSAEPLAKLVYAELSKTLPPTNASVQFSRKFLDSLYDKSKKLLASRPLSIPAESVESNKHSNAQSDAKEKEKGDSQIAESVHAPAVPSRSNLTGGTAISQKQTLATKQANTDIFTPHIPSYLRGIVDYALRNNKGDSATKLIETHFLMLATKLGKTDTIVADHLMELSQIYASYGQNVPAKKYQDRAYAIWLSIQPRLCISDSSLDYQMIKMASREGGLNALRLKASEILIRAANDFLQQGDSQTYTMCVKGAQACLEFAIAPTDRNRRISNLLQLSKLTRQRSDLAYARQAADLALRVQQDSKDDTQKVKTLLELARITLAQRDYASCSRFCRQCLDAAESGSTQNSKISAMPTWKVEALTMLCTCSSELAKTDEAIKYGVTALQAVEGISKTFDESTIDLIETLVDLHTKNKDFAQSVSFIDKGLDYCKSFGKTDTITYADLLWSKSRLKKAQSSDDEAKQLREEAGTIYYRYLKNPSDLVLEIHCYNQIAIWEDKRGNAKGAGVAALHAAEKVSEYVKTIFPQLSFGEQCAFLQNTIRPEIGYLIWYCSEELDQRRSAYTMLIQWKGLLISSLRKQSAVINSDMKNPAISKLIAEFEQVRGELAAWHLKMSDRSLTPDQWTSKNDQLTIRKEAIERELSQQASKAGYFDHAASITSYEFDTMLSREEVFIDFYRMVKPGTEIPVSDADIENTKPIYAAYIDSYDFYPKSVFIGTAEKVEKAIKDWRSDILDNAPDTESRKKLNEMVWDKIAKIVYSDSRKATVKEYVEPKRFFICPDAEIARIPWSTFFVQNPKGEPLLTTVFDSPREFINVRLSRLLSGGDTSRMMLVGNVDFADPDVESLAATEKEVQDVAEVAKKASIQTDILTGKDATKAAVLSKIPGESIVHLATHGYFASTQNLPSAWRESLGAVSLVRSSQAPMVTYATRNLLLSSGLLFAPPSSTHHADRLSAEELIGLDLSKCKLITLSACETGRGEEVTGQGVMGLRSALMAAGARSILMSLWKVPDDATQKLMTNFYTNLLIKKLPRAEALKLAQQAVRDDPSGKYKHPWFWAAWVLAGEGW